MNPLAHMITLRTGYNANDIYNLSSHGRIMRVAYVKKNLCQKAFFVVVTSHTFSTRYTSFPSQQTCLRKLAGKEDRKYTFFQPTRIQNTLLQLPDAKRE